MHSQAKPGNEHLFLVVAFSTITVNGTASQRLSRGPCHGLEPPLIFLRKPPPDRVQLFLDSQAGADFLYPGVGSTAAGQPPAGFKVDRTRIKLGSGEADFARARSAMQHWQHFALTWTEACWPASPPHPGQTGAVLVRSFGLWWLNGCRIVYVQDEPARFAFAYGTLPHHVEKGEERFLVEMDEAGDVWYEILAYSRPNKIMTWLGYPYVRILQQRFRNHSAAAMQRACLPPGPR